MAPAVGGQFVMREGQRVRVRTFALAVYLCGLGHKPTGAVLSDEGMVGEVIYIFPSAAAAGVADYHRDKEAMSRLMAETRKRQR